jgi:hypothetical protein
MRSSRALRSERGMVTAELAACLPTLVLVLAVALTAVSAVSARVRLQDAAREAARSAARGDAATARRLAAQAAPGARLTLSGGGGGGGGGEVVAVMRETVHPLTGLLPGLALTERAVAAVEPNAASP